MKWHVGWNAGWSPAWRVDCNWCEFCTDHIKYWCFLDKVCFRTKKKISLMKLSPVWVHELTAFNIGLIYSLYKNKHRAINSSPTKQVLLKNVELSNSLLCLLASAFGMQISPVSQPPSGPGSQLLGEGNNSSASVCSSFPGPPLIADMDFSMPSLPLHSSH